MLRYKVYAVVTHPKFPDYAFLVSLALYAAALYVICNPELLSINAFISENAVNANHHTTLIDNYISSTSLKEFYNWNNSSIYYSYIRSPRTTGKDCTALLFSYGSNKIGIQLAISVKRYMETRTWGGDLLFILYKPEPYALDFRKWLENNIGSFGVIRSFYDFDIEATSSYFSISGDGLNGIQTDLDQLFAMIKLIQRTNLEFKYPLPYKFQIPLLSASLSSWKSILSGNLNSPHAYLLNKGYLAVKVFTVTGHKSSPTNTASVLKLLEMIVRTVTGLDENLHAGYYFYYFTSSTSMMPLSKYSYIIAALVLPLLFQAILTLRESWWEWKSLVSLGVPYITGYFAYLLTVQNCEEKVSIFWIGFTIIINLVFKGSTKIFKAYSNVSLGLSIVIMSLKVFPLALALGLLVPIKVLVPSFKSRFIHFFLLAIITSLYYISPIFTIVNIESCSGHHVFYYALVVFCPCFWHLIYLFH